ncbi:MAG: ABC-2 family transporter protein, partial [Planctomycetota bacterium]|nr:ABC-2 family transporter protein [Planctomycetota bacterium]
MSSRSYLRYFAFTRMSFLELLAYRMRYYTGVVTYLLHVSVYYFIWKAIFEDRGDLVGGYRLEEIVTYVAIGWITRAFYFNNIDWDVANDIIEGRIAAELVRPVDYQIVQYASALGEALFRFLLFALPISFVVCALYPVMPPSSVGSGIAFVVSIGLSLLIFSGLNFLLGVAALHLKSIIGLIRAKQFLIQFLSGLLIPLALFPVFAQKIIVVLPMAGIAHVPLQIYLGRFDATQIALGLLYQVLWA